MKTRIASYLAALTIAFTGATALAAGASPTTTDEIRAAQGQRQLELAAAAPAVARPAAPAPATTTDEVRALAARSQPASFAAPARRVATTATTTDQIRGIY